MVRPRPIQSAAVFFQNHILETRTPYGKDTWQVIRVLGFMIYNLRFIVFLQYIASMYE